MDRAVHTNARMRQKNCEGNDMYAVKPGLLIALLALLAACGPPSVMQSLMTHQVSPDEPFCETVDPVGPSQLREALTPYAVPMAAGHTGVYALEDGAGALVARAWLTDNAARTIDAQYFIFLPITLD